MASRNNAKPSSRGKGNALMAQMGLLGGPDMQNIEQDLYGDLGDDEDFEAELLALQAEEAGSAGKVGGAPSKVGGAGGGLNVPQQGMKKIPSGLLELDHMVEASMKDLDEDVSDTEDPDLEAELLALSGDDDASYEPPAKASPPKPTTPAPQPVTQTGASGGHGQVSLITERLQMYENARGSAVSAGDGSKARRLDRGIKTLKDQLKKVKAGKPVAEEDIPPAVALTTTKPSTGPASLPTVTPDTGPLSPTSSVAPSSKTVPTPVSSPPRQAAPSRQAPPPHPVPAVYSPPEGLSTTDQQKHKVLHVRQEQFKSAAMEAKHRGDLTNAQRYLKTYKQFDAVMKALVQGQPIDLSQMPPPPPGFKAPDVLMEVDSHQGSVSPATQEPEEPVPETSAEEKQKIYSAPAAAPTSLMEALEQRLNKYKEAEAQAKEESNGSKARRMGRILKQYQDAIKITKSGKPYAYEDLPTPPGFPALPVPAAKSTSAASGMVPPSQQLAAGSSAASSQGVASSPQQSPPAGKSGLSPKPKPLQRQQSAMSRAEQQTLFLQERQIQFKKAAVCAKQKGEIELAKKYMKQAKGFDPMIEASQSGLPVNMSHIPAAPGSAKLGNLAFVSTPEDGQQESCDLLTEEIRREVGDRDEMYKKLEQELIQQIRTCTTNAEHFSKLGDVSSATKFDKLCRSCRQDLDALKNAYKHGDPVPRFHYENRSFSVVKSCTHLGDNDLELVLVRGINYNLPSGYQPNDLDTYAKYEFPFPKDEPQKGDSSTVKHTNSPEYDETFKINIERKSRVFMRLVNSKSMKVEIYYKRGFFKGDKLLGCANIKLQPLENVCVLHESYDLMDGRKAVGGKLEVKLQVRNPFINKQIEEVKEKWLIIDKFERALHPTATAQKAAATTGSDSKPSSPTSNYSSMEVLRYEKQLLEQQIRRYQGKLNESELSSLKHKVGLLDKGVIQMKERLKAEGIPGMHAYADSLERSGSQYLQEVKAFVAQGNREKAQILMTKKKIVEKEVEAIRSRYPR